MPVSGFCLLERADFRECGGGLKSEEQWLITLYIDFGRSRPNILIFWSILAFAIGFGWMGVSRLGSMNAEHWLNRVL